MESEERTPAWHAALASPIRRSVLDFLVESGVPQGAADVAAQMNLHITTARFHLDSLLAARLIEREPDRSGQRGRPRIRFTAMPAAHDDPQTQLSHALASVLTEDDDGGRARAIRAGEKWSEAFAGGLAAGAGTGAAPLVDLLARLEFAPELDEAQQTIALTTCPFREAARENPTVVCSVHLGLIQRVARTLGQDDTAIALRPFVGPHLCVVDLGSDWTARPSPEAAAALDDVSTNQAPKA
ncbi:helix-turn-helix domain-containing protein [Cryobacterium sp. PH31-O1]|uniref:helix-turn-helix transcriptional regulator n=1 Tax=Cryobacterium sp. PH31-O1 TaxID=3046306 RepID=UPI0024B9E8A3|nr:helix-turn-helix domain-containing protein [Cryobacterium sp. PH31-O1]MDJ0338488.1 helix-turn-helix domain-containing protein [Cryobacterium sp. PH31-O1]